MELNTIDTKAGLVVSNKDIAGNPAPWNADCPCSHLYKQVVTPGEVARYEVMPANLAYCAKYVTLSDGEVIDWKTGSVPYNFQVGGGSLEFGFTGNGSSIASGIKWGGNSLSSGQVPAFSGDLSNEYPSGWVVVKPGSSGHLPENLVYHHKSGAPMERGNSFARTTQRFPMKKRKPIAIGNTGVTYYLDNTDSGDYAFKDCLPALSMNTLSYEMGGGLVSAQIAPPDSNQIKYCGSAVTGSEWTLKLYSGEGVKITSVRLGFRPNVNMEDGDVFSAVNNSALDQLGSFGTQSMTVAWEIDADSLGSRALSEDSIMYGYGTFATGTGSNPLIGPNSASWISDVPEIWQESTVTKYNCFTEGFGIGLVSYLESSSFSGYPTKARATVNFYSDRGAGGTFRFSGGSESLADKYFPFTPIGNVDFGLEPGYCSQVAVRSFNFTISSNQILGTGDSGHYMKSGQGFSVISAVKGTGVWDQKKINGTEFKGHLDNCPQFTTIEWIGDPSGSMIGDQEATNTRYPYYSTDAQRKSPQGPIYEIEDRATQTTYSSAEGGEIGIKSDVGIFVNIRNKSVVSSRGYGYVKFDDESSAANSAPFLAGGIFNMPSNIKYPTNLRTSTILVGQGDPNDLTDPSNIWSSELYTAQLLRGPTDLMISGGLKGGPIDIEPMFTGTPITRDNATLSDVAGEYWRRGYSGYNQAYKGINIRPYKLTPTGLMSLTDQMSQFEQSLYLATGSVFGFTFEGQGGAGGDHFDYEYTMGDNPEIVALPRSQTEVPGLNTPPNYTSYVYNYDQDLSPNSASGISAGLLNYNILGPEDDFWGNYLGYSYYAVVGVALARWDNFDTRSVAQHSYLGGWSKYFINPPWKRSSSVLPWGHSEDISSHIDDFCADNNLYLVEKASTLTSPIDLHSISVANCISARDAAVEAGVGSTSLGLNFLIGSFWAYGSQNGTLDFPGFPTHDSEPLTTGARPFYKPWWGGNE